MHAVAIVYVLFTCFIDRPATCSTKSVMSECQIITHAEDESKIDLLITLLTKSYLYCAVKYQIEFHGEKKIVSLDSASANFTISATEAQSFQNEITVNTLDIEYRTGQVPCIFNLGGECSCMIQCFSG